LLSVGILCLALWLRITNLYSLPIFGDEGLHIAWAQQFSADRADYPLLMHGKLLLGVVLAQFQVLGPGALWLSRAAVVLLTMAGCAACIAIGKQIEARVGLLAGILYAVLPFAVFHERQALADPPMASFGSLTITFAFWAAQRHQPWRMAPLIAASLAVSAMFKLTGLVYVPVLLLAALALPKSEKTRRELGLSFGVALGLAAALALAFVASQTPRLGQQTEGGALIGQGIGFIECPPLICHGNLAEQIRRLRVVGPALLETIPPYWGWPFSILALVAWPASLGEQRRTVAVLGIFSLSALLVFAVSAKDVLAPRYLAPLAVPLAVLAAQGISGISRQIVHNRRALNTGITLALVLAALWPAAHDAAIILRPETVRLPQIDRWQYFTGPFAGPGFRDAALAIQALEVGNPAPPIVLYRHYLPTSITAQFDRSRLEPLQTWDARWPNLQQTLETGGHVYVIDEAPADQLILNEPDLVAVYPRKDGAAFVRLRRFTRSDPVSLSRLFSVVFSRPDEIRGDYLALAESLSTRPGDAALAAYPPHQLTLLHEVLANQSLKFLDLGGSPWDTASVIARLEEAEGENSLRVVFLNETRLDPSRDVETWLNTHLFRIGEQWSGALRLVEFAGNGPVAQTIPVGAPFGEHLTLETIEVLDATPSPGGIVRLRLNWKADQPTERPFKVFVHLFAEAGIVAQHDGQPVGELRPTTTWRAGEQIVDQFAIRLPPDLKPGTYQLRVGLYDLETEARLPAKMPDETEAEFYVGGQIVIRRGQ